MAESSKKSLVRVIKKLLEDNKQGNKKTVRGQQKELGFQVEVCAMG